MVHNGTGGFERVRAGSQWYGRVRNGTGGFRTRPYGQSAKGRGGNEPDQSGLRYEDLSFMHAV